MRHLLLLCGAALAGCGGSATGPGHDLGAREAIPWPADLTGKWATEFNLDLRLDGASDGGERTSALKLLTMWKGVQKPHGEVDTTWYLCAFPIPGLAAVPDQVLDPASVTSTGGRLDGTTDGAKWTQPPLAFVVGAQLADPANDALPADAGKPCSATVTTGCVVPDPISGKPGIALAASGLDPNVDLVYVDLRVQLSFVATFFHEGILHGDVSAAGLEAHVLGCHLAGAGDCAPADVARLEAAHPRVTVAGGTLRWRAQGPYFSCPIFEADPEGSLIGVELVDAGVPDLAPRGDMAGSSSGMSFSANIQSDVDAMGCATGGCHETFTRPGAMRLIFRPSTAALLRQNYQAVLPWTRGDVPGGRFVNEVPLPTPMRARWLSWVDTGSPF